MKGFSSNPLCRRLGEICDADAVAAAAAAGTAQRARMTTLQAGSAVGLLIAASLAPASPTRASPWDGSWRLDLGRSSAMAKQGAADGYRFKIEADGRIKWEIPSLGEVAEGRIDGRPMLVHRPTPTHGLKISVKPDGVASLVYTVSDEHGLQGGGRMTLVDQAKAWVDVTWGAGYPIGYAFVYVR